MCSTLLLSFLPVTRGSFLPVTRGDGASSRSTET